MVNHSKPPVLQMKISGIDRDHLLPGMDFIIFLPAPDRDVLIIFYRFFGLLNFCLTQQMTENVQRNPTVFHCFFFSVSRINIFKKMWYILPE